MKPGGRLVVPLTRPTKKDAATMMEGVIFLVTRDGDGYAARAKSGISTYNRGNPEARRARDRAERETSRRGTTLAPRAVATERAWLAGAGWSLTYD